MNHSLNSFDSFVISRVSHLSSVCDSTSSTNSFVKDSRVSQVGSVSPTKTNKQTNLLNSSVSFGDFRVSRLSSVCDSASSTNKIKIFQGGNDGFGHQLEGTIRLLSLSINNKAEYLYNYKKDYSFEHTNFNIDNLINYINCALSYLKQTLPIPASSSQQVCDFSASATSSTPLRLQTLSTSSSPPIQIKRIVSENRTFEEIRKNDIDYMDTLYLYDGVGCGRWLPNNFEFKSEVEKSLPILREVFVKNNIYLPKPSYNKNSFDSFVKDSIDSRLSSVCDSTSPTNSFVKDSRVSRLSFVCDSTSPTNSENDESDKQYKIICCHIRLGDAVGQRPLDNENIYNVIRYFQKYNDKYRIIIHSDGDIQHLAYKNTILNDKSTDVLQILSDFIYSDILIINYSSLSISAHLLADNNQVVIRPDKVGVTFNERVLDKCISCKEFLLHPFL